MLPQRRGARLGLAGCLLGSLLTPLLAASPATASSISATLVRTVRLSLLAPPSPDPSGIAWDPVGNRLIVVDSEVEEMAIYQDVNVYELDLQGTLTGSGNVTPPAPGFSNEPTGLSLDPGSGHLFVTDDGLDTVFRVGPGADSDFGTGDDVIVSRVRTGAFGNTDPEDVAFDTDTGDLFTVDGAGREVYRISPGSNGAFDGVPPSGDDTTSHFDTARFGAMGSEGLGYDAVRDSLLVVDPMTKKIYETSKTGTLLDTIDLAAANPRHAEDVVLAPAGADPGQMNMYLVDRGVDNQADPNENDGKMYEMSVSSPTGNQPPVVSAGADQVITAPDTASLSGAVSDDGLPEGSVVASAWSQLPGAPGTAVFTDATSPTTGVTFSAPGMYVLRLTADDTQLQTSDDVIVTVNPEGAATLDVSVGTSSDDAEEKLSGTVSRSSAALELAFQKTTQTVGLRFLGVSIPQGSTILDAHVQFQASKTTSSAAELTIEGEAADNPGTFTAAAFDVSSRMRTGAAVSWTPEPWTILNERGPKQRTPDLAAVVQEIVDRPSWSGSSLVLIITGIGKGKRVAAAFDGAGLEPSLHIMYTTA